MEAIKEKWIYLDERYPENDTDVLALCEIRYPHSATIRYVCVARHIERHSVEACGFEDSFEYDEETDELYMNEGWYEQIKNWPEFSSVAIADFVIAWRPMPHEALG